MRGENSFKKVSYQISLGEFSLLASTVFTVMVCTHHTMMVTTRVVTATLLKDIRCNKASGFFEIPTCWLIVKFSNVIKFEYIQVLRMRFFLSLWRKDGNSKDEKDMGSCMNPGLFIGEKDRETKRKESQFLYNSQQKECTPNLKQAFSKIQCTFNFIFVSLRHLRKIC